MYAISVSGLLLKWVYSQAHVCVLIFYMFNMFSMLNC